MKEQLITFKTAKLAKEKGFNHTKANCFGDNMAYNLDDESLIYAHNGNICIGYILAPTQSLLQRWLRDKYEIFVEIELIDNSKSYHFECVIITSNDRDYDDLNCMDSAKRIYLKDEFKTFEEALESGIFESLKLIKQK